MKKIDSSKFAKVRVVVIDDDITFGASAIELLNQAGFDARFHRGPFGSLSAIHETDCDVIVLDISMPKLDGNVVTRLIQNTFGKTKRVVLCSNMEEKTLERLARAIGAQGYLPKAWFESANIVQIVATIDPRRIAMRASVSASESSTAQTTHSTGQSQ